MSVARPGKERLEVRLSAAEKKTLRQAAAVQRKTVSAFLLESSLTAATEALASRRAFPVTTKQYVAFVAALDAAPKRKASLARLLNTPSVFED